MSTRTGKETSRKARIAEYIRRAVEDEGVFLLPRERAQLDKGITPVQALVLRKTPWSGAHPVASEATIQSLWAKGLVNASGQLTRAGVVLGQLLEERDTREK